jgi:hypothetical protein
VELFETKGADAPPAGSSAGEDGGLLSGLLSSLDFSEPTTFDGEEKTEYDPLRDGPLRYLGYSNELGEAFAAWLFPGGVPLRWVLGRRADQNHALPLSSGQAVQCAPAHTLKLPRRLHRLPPVLRATFAAPLLCVPAARSYAVAISYVLFDTYDKWQKTLGDAQQKLSTRPLPAGVDVDRWAAAVSALVLPELALRTHSPHQLPGPAAKRRLVCHKRAIGAAPAAAAGNQGFGTAPDSLQTAAAPA